MDEASCCIDCVSMMVWNKLHMKIMPRKGAEDAKNAIQILTGTTELTGWIGIWYDGGSEKRIGIG